MTRPNYNRYTQTGEDAYGNPTGSSDGVTGREKGWRELRAVDGMDRAPQIAEWNELQSIFGDRIRDIGDLIKRDGQTIGLQVRVNKNTDPATATIEWVDPNQAGKVYANGMLHVVPETTLNISAVGNESIAVRVVESIVTEVEDPTLYDPISSDENAGNPGCYRVIYTVMPVIKNADNSASLTDAYDLWFLQDGEIRSTSNDQLNEVDRNLIQYTSDITGNCLIHGMRVKVEDVDDSHLHVTIDRGRAYVGGKSVGYRTTTTLTINKSKFDTKTVNGELLTTKSKLSGTVPVFETSYKTASGPISQVTKLNALTLVKKRAGKGTFPFSQNPSDPYEILISTDIPYGPLTDVVSVYDVQAASYVNFSRTSGGFRLSAIPAGDIRVVWVYNATLSVDVDFEVTSTGDITTDKMSIVFLRNYPELLDSSAALNGAYNDRSNWVFPGLASTALTADAVTTDTIITVGTTYGKVVGQEIYIGNNRDTGVDEKVVIAEVISATQLRLEAGLAANYTNGTIVYNDPDFIGLNLSSNTTQLIADYRWLLDRVDIVYVDSDNNIRVQSGQSNKPAYAPPVPEGVLPLAKVNVVANGNASDITIEPYDVKALTQQELRELKREVETNRYNQAISSIQTSTYNQASAQGLNLKGIMTDPLVNSDVVEINTTPESIKDIAIDPDNGTLSPQLDMENVLLTVNPDPLLTTCFVGKRAACLGHSLVGSTSVRNLTSTDVEVVRGTTNIPKPILRIDTGHYLGPADRPASFKFLNVNTRILETIPSSLEGGYWKTRQNEVPWLNNLALYLPAQTIKLSGRNFAAGSSYQVAVDGQVIAPLGVTVDATGIFTEVSVAIPANQVSGHNSRTVSILDSNNNVLAATIMGATPSEASFLPIAYDSLATSRYKPVAQTFTFTRDVFVRGVNLFMAAKGPAGSWLEVQVCDTNDDGTPGETVLASKRLTAADVSTTAATQVLFEDALFMQASKAYALCLVSNVDGFQTKKAVVGKVDASDKLVTNRPLAQGYLYTSTDGTGFTVQTEASMTFELLECSFRADKNTLVFNEVTPNDFASVPLILARAQQMVPRGCAIDWSYSINGNTATSPLPLDVDGTLDPQTLPQTATAIVLRATIRGTSEVSSLVGSANARLLMFNPRTQGVYVARNPESMPDYTKVRYTMEVLTAAGTLGLRVLFSTLSDPYGKSTMTLTGSPVSGDVLDLTVDGNAYSFTYAPAGAASLADFAGTLASEFVAQYPDYEIVASASGSDQKLVFTRVNKTAFVTGDVSAIVTQQAGSTLVAQAAIYDYVEVPRVSAEDEIVDDSYTKRVWSLSAIDATPPVGQSRTFRIRVELETTNVLAHPRARKLATIVSS